MKVPDHLVAEILDGELHTSPRPAPRQAAAKTVMGGALHGPFDRGRGGPGGWIILFEPELHLGLEVLRLENGRWTILSTWAKSDLARAEPFDAIDLDLTLLWESRCPWPRIAENAIQSPRRTRSCCRFCNPH